MLVGLTSQKIGGRHIDPHVHCRDWAEARKSTIAEVMKLARSQGIVAIIDMPNTKPSIISQELVESRLRTAEAQGCLEGYYIHMGLTADPKQVAEAIHVFKTNERVVGMKLYAGRTTGELEVLRFRDQMMIFRVAREMGYTGVISVHCEEESFARPALWVPTQPYTWNKAKPPEMEIESVRNMIKFAQAADFMGYLHICHTSTPEAVELVNDAKKHMRISCGVTPHHLTLSTDDMRSPDGIRYKVNPPIRDRQTVIKLNELLREGKIDWIETDHAPHMPAEKTYNPAKPDGAYMSGIRSLEGYASFLEKLVKDGISLERIEELTYTNIKNVFTKIVE
jgi:dihydroorotase